MSDMLLTHRTRSQEVAVAMSSTASGPILCGDVAAGMVHVGGITATATLSVFGSSDGVTYRELRNGDGSAATITLPAAGGMVPMPDAVFPLRFVKLVSGTDLGTAASVVVSVKS